MVNTILEIVTFFYYDIIPNMVELVDAHSHIDVETPIFNLYNTYNNCNLDGLLKSKANLNSVGIHPKYIDKIDWDRIKSFLQRDSRLLIGEIGLDRSFNSSDRQLKVFNRFLELSIMYDRSITIHCVKKWGSLFDCLKGYNLDIPHLFHGFNGSRESLKIALRGNSYFSFSLRELSREKLRNSIRYIPINRILVESDMKTDEYLEVGSRGYIDRMLSTYRALSNIKQIDIEELKEILLFNFKSFVNLGDI